MRYSRTWCSRGTLDLHVAAATSSRMWCSPASASFFISAARWRVCPARTAMRQDPPLRCLTRRAPSSSLLYEGMVVASTSVPVSTVIARARSCRVTARRAALRRAAAPPRRTGLITPAAPVSRGKDQRPCATKATRRAASDLIRRRQSLADGESDTIFTAMAAVKIRMADVTSVTCRELQVSVALAKMTPSEFAVLESANTSAFLFSGARASSRSE